MPWELFWTVIGQIVVACFCLMIPISILVFLVSSAVSSGLVKKGKVPEVAEDERV